jgi:hypothetical protein
VGRPRQILDKYWNGKIDDLRLRNRARGACEIGATYGAELTNPQPGLVAHWRFNLAIGNTTVDNVGMHVATLSSGATLSSEVPAVPRADIRCNRVVGTGRPSPVNSSTCRTNSAVQGLQGVQAAELRRFCEPVQKTVSVFTSSIINADGFMTHYAIVAPASAPQPTLPQLPPRRGPSRFRTRSAGRSSSLVTSIDCSFLHRRRGGLSRATWITTKATM